MTITSTSSNTTELPSQTYAIQVHRQHAVRVRDALEQSTSQTGWKTLNAVIQKDGDATSSLCSTWNHGIGDIESLPPTEKTTCILSPKESGPRQSRTGYNMIITRNATCSPADLPPLARQHISWAGRLTNETSIVGKTTHNSSECSVSPAEHENVVRNLCALVANLAFQKLNMCGFVFAETTNRRADELRLDVRPKSFALPLCRELQRLAVEAGFPSRDDTDPNDPFDGPMRMTQSIAKSSCILSAVFDSMMELHVASNSRNPPTSCYWGVTATSEHAAMINKLNDFAKKEVRVAKPEDATCVDATPTSRAYYKLAQIFEEYLTPSMLSAEVDGVLCSGLDLGASPGGWTQVLFNNGLRPVISVDPGLLAPRVEGLDGIRYIKGDFNGDNAIIRGIADQSPYTAIVCDANITHGIDEKITRMIGRVAGELGKGEGQTSLITLPAVFILTLKFAYKTEQSMKRNYIAAMKMIPNLLMNIIDAQCRVAKCSRDHVACRYTVLHLHANSDSERTVLAIFDETDEGRKRKRDSTKEL
eukprot:CAMPEP_0181040614 /NCGR_PEP_ID=MMETSP1070-20121207/11141_1 /TAXON_ID=265543 /ORGANISM="Minutocellus polymorphus, Strain NH13" /LENGTH=532 /DNA_ID=CAMNT_0023118633 /DNA_START=25 /DNA_END=1623 /DNA_ORIENTATION=+